MEEGSMTARLRMAAVATTLLLAILLLWPAPRALADKADKAGKTKQDRVARLLDLPATPYNYARLPLPDHYRTPQVRRADNTPRSNPVTDHGATLGRVLFYDPTLSINGKTACASCHHQSNAFSEPKPLSIGFNGGKVNRNAMSLIDLRYYARGRFFWDERAGTLEKQVLMPIENEIEMGHKLPNLVRQLASDPIYPPLFKKAFGDSQVTEQRISRALAQFLRSIVSYRSKYDQGLQKVSSLLTDFPNFTRQENEGKRIFLGRANCASCHMPGGRRGGGEGALFFMARPRNNGIDRDLKAPDAGVGLINLSMAQIGQFKSPSLRNVELTAPYMHDGRLAKLEDVIEHYSRNVKPHPFLDGRLRGRGRSGARRLNLSGRQKEALVAFLKTLTDRELVSDPRYSNPFRTTAATR
jgi:cytochrome c peroxidase